MEAFSIRREIPLWAIPFAKSIVMVLGSPKAKPAQPRALIGGHLISTTIGLVVVKIMWTRSLWVELAVSPDDVPLVAMGATVSVAARTGTERTEGKVVFISPMLDKDTRLARVVAEIDQQGRYLAARFVRDGRHSIQ